MRRRRFALSGLPLIALTLTTCQRAPRTVVDIDQNTYPVVAIGAQVWLAANLRTSRSADGVALETHPTNEDSTGAPVYGLLYNWATAQHACMRGWHLPSDSEWALLAALLGPSAGGALKDTIGWLLPNVGATNHLGFAARAAGYWSGGEFDSQFGQTAVFWSATPQDTHFVWTRTLASGHDSLRRVPQHPNFGFSVRCVKDAT